MAASESLNRAILIALHKKLKFTIRISSAIQDLAQWIWSHLLNKSLMKSFNFPSAQVKTGSRKKLFRKTVRKINRNTSMKEFFFRLSNSTERIYKAVSVGAHFLEVVLTLFPIFSSLNSPFRRSSNKCNFSSKPFC